MRPLTESTPKPLIKICGKPILQYVVEALPPEIDELILVVGYFQEQIREVCGDTYLGKKVTYAVQENFSGGTGDALLCTKSMVTGKFLFMYADDIHGSEALSLAVKEDHAILGTYSETPENFGVLIIHADGSLKEILEKPKNPPSNLVNIGGFVLTPEIFNCTVTVSEEYGELFVTDMLTKYARTNRVMVIKQDMWIPVGKPEDISRAESILCPVK
jgi:bifunctional UDP-N-acetylglucosamine pyrophosphorylase/glucosamine-1-phosphate N-acetyltransferase